MKSGTKPSAVLLVLAVSARAVLDYSWRGSQTIPNNTPAGYGFTFDV